MLSFFARFFVLVFLAIGCLGALPVKAAPLRVVASFSLLGDMAATIGGDVVTVQTLVKPDSDAHTYQPTPRDAKAIAEADIVLVNGLGFEGWMTRLVGAARAENKLVIVSQTITPRTMIDEAEGKITDPHAWQDVRNAMQYVSVMAAAFEKARPDQTNAIAARAKTYLQRLAALDQDIRAQIAAIPAAKRQIITSHDAFGYFGAAYGVTFLAPQGISTEADPSAATVAKLIKQIKQTGVQEVFIENMTDPRLVQQIARETGAKRGGELYADALSSATGPAPTYIAMMEYNLAQLTRAMANVQSK